MKGIILAAGYGRRMAALTARLPKPMLPVANVPAVERILLHFTAAGVTEVLMITGYRAEGIESYCGDGSRWGVSIRYHRQIEVSGTGSATRSAEEFVGEAPFILTYGDILLDAPEYRAVVSLFHEVPCAAVSALNRMPEVAAGSAVYVDQGRITNMVEKPPPGTAGTNLNNAGVFVLTPAIFRAIDRTPRSARGEYELTEAIQTLIDGGERVMAHVIRGKQYDIGTPEAFLDTNMSFLAALDQGSGVRGQGSVKAKTTTAAVLAENFASPHAVIEPPALIGQDCTLERCRIGPGVCLGDGVRVGHSAIVQHSVVLPGADIGDGAVLAYAVVGHGASVSNRQTLRGTPERVMVVGEGESEE